MRHIFLFAVAVDFCLHAFYNLGLNKLTQQTTPGIAPFTLRPKYAQTTNNTFHFFPRFGYRCQSSGSPRLLRTSRVKVRSNSFLRRDIQRRHPDTFSRVGRRLHPLCCVLLRGTHSRIYRVLSLWCVRIAQQRLRTRHRPQRQKKTNQNTVSHKTQQHSTHLETPKPESRKLEIWPGEHLDVIHLGQLLCPYSLP